MDKYKRKFRLWVHSNIDGYMPTLLNDDTTDTTV